MTWHTKISLTALSQLVEYKRVEAERHNTPFYVSYRAEHERALQ